jgi:hypothetical protein
MVGKEESIEKDDALHLQLPQGKSARLRAPTSGHYHISRAARKIASVFDVRSVSDSPVHVEIRIIRDLVEIVHAVPSLSNKHRVLQHEYVHSCA